MYLFGIIKTNLLTLDPPFSFDPLTAPCIRARLLYTFITDGGQGVERKRGVKSIRPKKLNPPHDNNLFWIHLRSRGICTSDKYFYSNEVPSAKHV